MANRVGTRRRKLSDEEFVELSLPAPPSARPPSARRAAAALAASEELADVLTPEEEYLIRVFRRYRQQTTSTSPHTTQGGENKKVMSSNRLSAKLSDSDRVVDRNSTLPAATAKTPVQPAGCGGEEAKATGLARNKEVLVPPAPQQPTVAPPTPTDTASRLKLLLEKKRKAAATGSTRVGAAASGAGVQRKAKISKVVGASSSATSARLDSVKYPASGLLLKRDFRTFQESDEDGERIIVPAEPLVCELKNFGLADTADSGGGGRAKKQLNETLVMRVTVPPDSSSWGVNIGPKNHNNFTDTLFHFNPRRRFVAMNNRKADIWGQQEKYMLQRWPELFNVSITVAVQIDQVGFRVAVDGKYCDTFKHRTKPTDIESSGDQLTLQVMTADDYGTNLGLIVHEIWWGHKDTMPGLPGAPKERQSAPARSTDSWRGGAGESDDAFADLHVGNLPPMPSPEEQEMMRKRLLDLFHRYGAIQVRVFHREKNFGFVKFRDHSGAARALDELSGEEIHGRTIRLSKAASR